MTLHLYGMSYSPYTERARWALDAQRVPYAFHEHVPLTGELALRMRAGQWKGKVSVPLAVEGDAVLRDSLAIARHASAAGDGTLFADATVVEAWDAKADRALGAGRALLLPRLLADRQALRESLPSWIPGSLRAASVPAAASATRFLARKYGTDAAEQAESLSHLRGFLAEVRSTLGDRATLLGAFSYADVTAAVVLQMVSPVDDAFIPLGTSTRAAWTEPTLAREFADLVTWRDALYASRRRPVARAS